MTPNMIKFAQTYLENGMDATEAVRVAGYKGTKKSHAEMGSRLLKHFEIKDYLAKHAKKAADASQLTVEKVLEDLEKAKTEAMKGYPTQAGWRKDLPSYLRAVELQGKYLKMFTDKLELNLDGHSELMNVIKAKLSGD